MNISAIEEAISLCSTPAFSEAERERRAQALAFCNHVRADHEEGWRVATDVIGFKQRPLSAEVRFFALQCLESWLRNDARYSSLQPTACTAIKQALLDASIEDKNDPVYVRNKLAQCLVLLMRHHYPDNGWPSFFHDLVQLYQSGHVDLFLRVCLAVDEEVVCLYIQRTPEQLHRNTIIKDHMRDHAMSDMVKAWFQILEQNAQFDYKNASLRCLGLYVSWIDLNLVVTPDFIRGLYQYMTVSELKTSACECLYEIVNKGMKPVDKLHLIKSLSIMDILQNIRFTSDDAFDAQLVKLISAVGLELVQTADPACECALESWPILDMFAEYYIRVLPTGNIDIATQLYAFASAYWVALKKWRKKTNDASIATNERVHTGMRITNAHICCAKYTEDTFSLDQEDDDMIMMNEARSQIRGLLDQATNIDHDVVMEYLRSVVFNTLNAGANVEFGDVELALFVLFTYGETVKDNPSQLAPLGEILLKVFGSNVVNFPHVSVALQFFEIAVRYAAFIDMNSVLLPQVIEPFIDHRGIHHPEQQTHKRIWYLLHRFIKAISNRIDPDSSFAIISAMQDLMMIKPAATSLDAFKENSQYLDNQIYLFETVGILLSTDQLAKSGRQTEMMVFNPLLTTMQQIMQGNLYKSDTPENSFYLLSLHHLIVAIGAICKGFPEHSTKNAYENNWSDVFLKALEGILACLETLKDFEIIRESARFTFQRLVTCVGPKMLPYLRPLIHSLTANCTAKELCDLVPFVSALIHRNKSMMADILTDFVVHFIPKICYHLNQQVTGTDDQVLQNALQKAYLNFLQAIFNAELDDVLIDNFQTVFQSVIHFAGYVADPSIQKLAYVILHKIVILWSENGSTVTVSPTPLTPGLETGPIKLDPFRGSRSTTVTPGISPAVSTTTLNGSDARIRRPIPGFTQLLFSSLTPLCFEIPLSPSMSLSDGSSVAILNEISGILKSMVSKYGQEYTLYLNHYFASNGQDGNRHEFIESLMRMEARSFRNYFRDFLERLKRK